MMKTEGDGNLMTSNLLWPTQLQWYRSIVTSTDQGWKTGAYTLFQSGII